MVFAGGKLRPFRALISTAVLSYTLGLRHALDADHISVRGPQSSYYICIRLTNQQAIDLMTRRLVASGQRPVTVGTFFSLGHSTFVPLNVLLRDAFSYVPPYICLLYPYLTSFLLF